MVLIAALLLCAVPLGAQNPTELWRRGYSVIPAPQRVRLEAGEVLLGDHWQIEGPANHAAVKALLEDGAAFHQVRFGGGSGSGPAIRLAVQPGAVKTGAEPGVDRQAYRLSIGDGGIAITGNGDPGLFYGAQTLLQLMKRDGAGRLVAPKGVIEDWPRLELRFLHWDTKHHQDRMETLKRYLDWTARFKANMIAFELEDKFEYPSHPVIGAPGAFTTAQLQEIVAYARERFIQVVPDVQAPAHMAYVLKHPEFAHLRADGNNYQSALCDPKTYELIFSMYDDVIRATPGVDYLLVSTDEVYYAGIESLCDQPYNEENRSLRWAEFVRRARNHLAQHGRRAVAWVEYPLLPRHVKLLPPDLIDGVIGEREYLEGENQLGMRQLAYVSMQGSEFLFPDHFSLEGEDEGGALEGEEERIIRGRLAGAYQSIALGRHWKGRPIGVFGAAWDDSGLHNETFWLGWSAVAQWGWNPGTVSPEQHTAEFFRAYYGPGAEGMDEIYRGMQRQARAWERTWDRVVSRARGPVYGDSDGKGLNTTRYDLTLGAPPLPGREDLAFTPRFAHRYGRYLAEARVRMAENRRLALALHDNLGRLQRNHYNLEVFLALARFMGHHWHLLAEFARVEDSLLKAYADAKENQPADAVTHLVSAHNEAFRLRHQGERIFSELQVVFERCQFPKGQAVGGRTFFHKLDDTKDHWADRTPDLGFMMAPERSIGWESWLKELADIARDYGARHTVPVKGLLETPAEVEGGSR